MKKYPYREDITFDGRRYTIRAETKEELIEKKTRKLRDLEEGKVAVSGSMKVSTWTKICLDTYKADVSEDVRKDMEYRINKHILSAIGPCQIKSVTPLQCQMILSAQKDMSYSHIKKLSQELHFIFETARKNHFILENPADDLVLPRGRKGKRRSITPEERTALLAVSEDYRPFILFLLMLYCGCRPSEAIRCMGSDISVVKDTPMLHVRGTKTATSDRFVPIPIIFYPKIKETPYGAPIAPNSSGRPHGESSYNRLVSRLRREMNLAMGAKTYRNRLVEPLPLAKDFVPYNLRHTYCTDLCRKGVDVRVAQRLMGHASISITSDIYTHVDQTDLTEVAKLLNA